MEFKRECLPKVKSIAEDLNYMNYDEMLEYFDDYLDVKYLANRWGDYYSALIWVSLGGPNIWIDTKESVVKLAWGGECVEWGLKLDTVIKIDEIFAEHYYNLKHN